MDKPTLSSSEKKKLRGLAMNLNPLVSIGKQGITPNVLSVLDFELSKRGLVKIKIIASSRDERKSILEKLSDKTQSEICGLVGKTASLYRPIAEEE